MQEILATDETTGEAQLKVYGGRVIMIISNISGETVTIQTRDPEGTWAATDVVQTENGTWVFFMGSGMVWRAISTGVGPKVWSANGGTR